MKQQTTAQTPKQLQVSNESDRSEISQALDLDVVNELNRTEEQLDLYQAWLATQSERAEDHLEAFIMQTDDLKMNEKNKNMINDSSLDRASVSALLNDTEVISDESEVDAEVLTDLPLSRLDKAFADFLQDRQPSPDSDHHLLACLVSYQYGRGHACLDLQSLSKRPLSTLGLEAKFKHLIPPYLSEKAASCPWVLGENSPLVLFEQKLYLRRNYYAESLIQDAILQRLSPIDFSSEEQASLTAILNQLFENSSTDTNTPDWQKVACAIACRANFTLITGGPGTGKTTTVTKLLALLMDMAKQQNKTLKIALAAPTGKAAARLNESMQRARALLPESLRFSSDLLAPAQTLHKLLGLKGRQSKSAHAATPSLLAYDLVLVDEASMIDLQMMALLMLAVPNHAKLILLGDKDQLASVEAGAVMGQLCAKAEFGFYSHDTVQWIQKMTGQNLSEYRAYHVDKADSLSQQTVMLRESYRFTAKSKIGQVSRAVNKGQALDFDSILKEQSEQDKIMIYEPVHAKNAQLIEIFKTAWQSWLQPMQSYFITPEHIPECSDEKAYQLLQSFAQFQVLCALREGSWGVSHFNRFIAQGLGFPNTPWFVGRPVMVTQNNYQLGLMNGDIGLCLPKNGTIKVAFINSEQAIQWVLPSRLEAVETVFAMTVHKSQGSEFDQVCLVLPDQYALVLTRELLYTGITRAKKVLHLVIPNREVLNNAIKYKVNRSGGLKLNERSQ